MPSMGNFDDDDYDITRSYDIGDLHLKQPDPEETSEEAEEIEPAGAENGADVSVEYADGQILFDLSDFDDDKIFATKQVAALAGLKTAQDVRNLLGVWDVIIQVKRDDKGRALWNKENVEKLQEMLTVKKAQKCSTKAVVDYYLKPAEETPEETLLPQSLANKEALEAVTRMISKSFEDALDKKTEKLQEDNEKILKQIEDNKKEADTSMQQVVDMIKSLQESQKTLQEEQKTRDEEIRRLKEENEALKASLEEQKKKKTFFGIPLKS